MNVTTPIRNISAAERLGIIDADFHPMPVPSDPQVAVHMSQRWKDYVAKYGMGFSYSGLYAPAQREFTHRLDALKDNRVGIDPLWAREQVLDPFDMSGVVLTCPQSYILNSGGNMPEELSMELARAFNNALAYTWMAADPRYYAAIVHPARPQGRRRRDPPLQGRPVRRPLRLHPDVPRRPGADRAASATGTSSRPPPITTSRSPSTSPAWAGRSPAPATPISTARCT